MLRNPGRACPPNVRLTLSASDDASGVDLMQISKDPLVAGRLWEPFRPYKPWYLPADLTTVYVRFRDHAGTLSRVLTAWRAP